MLDRMVKELSLDEVQRNKAETIMKSHEDRNRAIYKDFQLAPEEQAKMEGLRRARREARQSGNAQEAARAEGEIREIQKARLARLAPMQEKLAAIEKEEHNDLLAVMRDDQKAKFEQVWQEVTASRRPFGPMRSPQALKAIIDKLPDLTTDQKQQIESAFAEFKKSAREAVKEDSPEYREKARKLHEEVMKVLTPEQQEKVSTQLRGGPGMEGRRGFRGRREGAGPASQPVQPRGANPATP